MTPFAVMGAPRPLTMADAIGTTRLMSNNERRGTGYENISQQPAWISADGQRYLVVTVRGDVAKNGVWMELLTGRLGSLSEATAIRSLGRFFTPDRGPTQPITIRYDYRITWLPDNESVAVLAEDAQERAQVVIANARTGQSQFRTSSAQGINNYDAGLGGAIFYVTETPTPADLSAAQLQRGFVVTNADAFSLLKRDFAADGRRSYEFYLSRPGETADRRVELAARRTPEVVRFAPDGRKVLVDALPRQIPAEWRNFGNEPVGMGNLAAQAQTPNGGNSWLISQLYVVDVESATARPLWPAPKTPEVNTLTWSPRSDFVLLCPTYLPVDAPDAAGRDGKAAAVINVTTGEFQALPMPGGRVGATCSSDWHQDGTIELTTNSQTLRYRKKAARWQLEEQRAAIQKRVNTAPVRLELRQDMNTPPKLFAVEPRRARERLVLDLNPMLLTDFTLGRAAPIDWQDAEGRNWHGRLYYPVGYVKGQRYPLVIQAHGVAKDNEFSLYGKGSPIYVSGLGPSGASIYCAQPLANRGMAVLQVEDKPITEPFFSTPREPQVYASAFERGARHLIDAGLVAADRVGLSAFSRSGWHVQYALTHPEFPWAAALTSDNFNASYVTGSLAGSSGSLTTTYADIHGAPGYGPGLLKWIDSAPGFNAQRITAPLRLQSESGPMAMVLVHWELFNTLRLLSKPVELYVIPDIDHGTHNLQNPQQLLAAAEGAVDWFDFWLNGREDSGERKAEQYSRWRELKRLRDAQISSQTSALK